MKVLRGKGLRIHALLLGANAFVLLVPLLSVLALRLYENYLVRQTERQLIAQSIAIGEIYRELWLTERGLDPRVVMPDFRHPGRSQASFIPIEPVSSLRYGVLPPQPGELRPAPTRDTAETRAGARIEPMLRRMQVYNLSAVRILDAEGCVVATTRGEAGLCMDSVPEVAAALAGRYSALVRERISDEPLPPLSDVRSRGRHRADQGRDAQADAALRRAAGRRRVYRRGRVRRRRARVLTLICSLRRCEPRRESEP